MNTPAKVKTRPLPTPMRNTAATLSMNATIALDRKINGPTVASASNGAQPSVNGMMHRLMRAQTYEKWMISGHTTLIVRKTDARAHNSEVRQEGPSSGRAARFVS